MAKLRYYIPVVGLFYFFMPDKPAVVGAVCIAVYLIVVRFAPDFKDKLIR